MLQGIEYIRVISPKGPVPNFTARLDSSEKNLEGDGRNYRAILQWKDLPDEGDNYRLDALLHFMESSVLTDTAYSALGFEYESLYDDIGEDGRTWTERSLPITDFAWLKNRNSLIKLNTFLLTTDVAYLKYHQSLVRYELNFTDPGKLYTNIQGGFGVFAAYRWYKVEIPLK